MTNPPPKLLDQLRDVLRARHYSIRTEDTYVDWARRFILFHHKQHPAQLGSAEVNAFLTHLAVQGKVAASTQNQALSALLFLYREVLQTELDGPLPVVRAKKPEHLPVVLTRAEVQAVLGHLAGEYLLMAQLLYGSGLRLMECVRLRVKDVDFAMRQITVRDSRGVPEAKTVKRIGARGRQDPVLP